MFNIIPYILVVILYSLMFQKLYMNVWENVDYTHAYFILPIALVLVWRKRKDLTAIAHNAKAKTKRASVNKTEMASLASLIVGILLFVVGNQFGYASVQTFSLIPVLFGLTGYLYGRAMVRAVTFPILYLLLLVPPPSGIVDSLTLPMRYGVSHAADVFLRSLFIPVSREGLLLYVGGHEIYMGQPCSGLRSLVTMFALALVYVYLLKSSLRHKLILLFSVIPLALVGNFIRVVMLCLVTYFLGEEVGQGFYHNFSGIVIFVIMIAGLMIMEAFLKGQDDEE